jgi:hypothetical protein
MLLPPERKNKAASIERCSFPIYTNTPAEKQAGFYLHGTVSFAAIRNFGVRSITYVIIAKKYKMSRFIENYCNFAFLLTDEIDMWKKMSLTLLH